MGVRAPLHQLLQRLVQVLFGLGHVLYGRRVQRAFAVLPKVVEQTLVLERMFSRSCSGHKSTRRECTIR